MMDITIYQIDPDRDQNGVLFGALDQLEKWQGSPEVDAGIYGKVFEGEIDAKDLEEIYEIFNLDKPDGYHGRSLSVSDVVAVRDPDSKKIDYFFCDSIGFKKVDFDASRAYESFKAKIKVVICEPGRKARVAEIGTELEDLQRAVGGMIEAYYPFEEQVCIVCNDEGKFNGMSPCRAIFDDERKIQDIIFGPFFICDCSTPEFGSLNAEQLERYRKMFDNPERYFRIDGEIKAIPHDPTKDKAHQR